MRNSLKRRIGGEEGKVLVLVLVMLVVGGLVLAPLLGLMSTGLASGQVYEKKAAELYAADAGVEDAIWRINYPDIAGLPPIVCGDTWDEEFPPYYLEVNRKSVEVVIEYLGLATYRITSTARGDGSSTQIEAYISTFSEYVNYSGLMDHIITINEMLTQKELDALENELSKVTLACREGCMDTCADECDGIYDYEAIPEGCYGCGVVYNYPDALWPKAPFLTAWYRKDINDVIPYPSSTLDVKDYAATGIGPFYRDGVMDDKGIINTGAKDLTLKLNGTVYITGDTLIGKTDGDFILDLNGHTIFVESDTGDNKYALEIGGKVTIKGPGAIIAIGNIWFEPKASLGGNEETVFVFSVSATTALQPSGSLYGALAGHWYVEVKSGTKPTLTYPPGGMGDLFNFPSLFEVDRTCSVASWEIK